MSVPGVEFDWDSYRQSAAGPFSQYRVVWGASAGVHYMGVLALSLAATGLVFGRRRMRAPLFVMLVLAGGVVVLFASSPVLAPLLPSLPALGTINHFGDQFFQGCGFLVLLFAAGLGLEAAERNRSALRWLSFVFFGSSAVSLGLFLGRADSPAALGGFVTFLAACVATLLAGAYHAPAKSRSRLLMNGLMLSEFGDVVVVSVNHRLNVIGTLDVSTYVAPYASSRNTGMADLVAALEWIHENIEVFGGDPGNVTIFGQSGGGLKVTCLMHMPAAKDLFHKVICESGGVDYRGTNPAEIIKGQQAVAAETLKNLGLDGSQMDKVKKVPYHELFAARIAANETVGKQLGRTFAAPRLLPQDWYPVADDVYILREFCDWADFRVPVVERHRLRTARDEKADVFVPQKLDA